MKICHSSLIPNAYKLLRYNSVILATPQRYTGNSMLYLRLPLYLPLVCINLDYPLHVLVESQCMPKYSVTPNIF